MLAARSHHSLVCLVLILLQQVPWEETPVNEVTQALCTRQLRDNKNKAMLLSLPCLETICSCDRAFSPSRLISLRFFFSSLVQNTSQA